MVHAAALIVTEEGVQLDVELFVHDPSAEQDAEAVHHTREYARSAPQRAAYSARSATAGSTRAARRAGSQVASNVTDPRMTLTIVNVSESR